MIGVPLQVDRLPESHGGTVQLPTDKPPESSGGNVIYRDFYVGGANPFRGSTNIRDYVQQHEQDPTKAVLLRQARQELGEKLQGEKPTLRDLRLSRGLSQQQLAERANTNQSHIANIELGRNDPGTVLVEKLGKALGLPGEKVYSAIRQIDIDRVKAR
ncbi:MAG: helix-turn-helix transcriptional regulator [Steroidobacteraceae bacterium]